MEPGAVSCLRSPQSRRSGSAMLKVWGPPAVWGCLKDFTKEGEKRQAPPLPSGCLLMLWGQRRVSCALPGKGAVMLSEGFCRWKERHFFMSSLWMPYLLPLVSVLLWHVWVTQKPGPKFSRTLQMTRLPTAICILVCSVFSPKKEKKSQNGFSRESFQCSHLWAAEQGIKVRSGITWLLVLLRLASKQVVSPWILRGLTGNITGKLFTYLLHARL